MRREFTSELFNAVGLLGGTQAAGAGEGPTDDNCVTRSEERCEARGELNIALSKPVADSERGLIEASLTGVCTLLVSFWDELEGDPALDVTTGPGEIALDDAVETGLNDECSRSGQDASHDSRKCDAIVAAACSRRNATSSGTGIFR